MKKAAMNKLFCAVFIITILFASSCDIFKLEPEARANPMDPGSEASVPRILSITPSDGAAGVEPYSVITVTFSEAIDAASVTSGTFEVTAGGAAVAGSYSVDGKSVTFTPSALLTAELTHSVILSTGILNLAGRGLSTEASFDFTIRSRRWTAPVLVESDNTGDATNPQVAVDSSSRVTAVWTQDDGSQKRVMSNRFTVGSGWGTAEAIEPSGGSDSYSPRLAVNSTGAVVAAWYKRVGSYYNVLGNCFNPASGWGTAGLLENETAGATVPQVAVDSFGNAIAVWKQDSKIYFNRYTAEGWVGRELLQSGSETGTNVQVSVDQSDNIFAVWSQDDGTRYNILSRRYAAGSGWDAVELIEDENSGNAIEPQIVVDSAGCATAVWQQYDGTRYNIWTNRHTPGTGWSSFDASALDEEDNYDTYAPQLTVDSSGSVTVVWKQSDGTRFNIWAKHYTIASGWGAAVKIETDDRGPAEEPQVATDSSGKVTAVWRQSDGALYSIWANQFTEASGWGTAFLLETNENGLALSPQLAVDSSGNITVVWSQVGDGVQSVWATHYN